MRIHKLYLLEGIDDQAVSSLAFDQEESLKREGHNVKLYTEGMLHPADMAMQAYLSMEEYKEFLNDVILIWKYDRVGSKDAIIEQISSKTCFEEGHAIVAYRMLEFPSSAYEPLLADLSAREIYNGRLSYQSFVRLHLLRWNHFCKTALNSPNTIFLFTNALFKNHIGELMGFYDMEDERILTHLSTLLRQVHSLNPVLLYLTTTSLSDYCSSLTEASYLSLQSFVESSNYGRLHGLKGRHGMVEYLMNRTRIEELALNSFKAELPDLTIQFSTTKQLPLSW